MMACDAVKKPIENQPPEIPVGNLDMPIDDTGNYARDGDIAIRQEFDAAMERDTRAAWELFIARHPDHPLTKRAKHRLAEHADGTPTRAPISRPPTERE